jgi:hypothetical protein
MTYPVFGSRALLAFARRFRAIYTTVYAIFYAIISTHYTFLILSETIALCPSDSD